MSTNISQNLIKKFILNNVGATMTQKEAQKLGLDKQYKAAAEEADVNELDLNDILNDNDLYEQFATLYVNEQNDKRAAKDEETEKKEQLQVKDKNGAGV